MTASSSRSRARPRRAAISSSIPRRTARASRFDLDSPIATQRGRDGTGAFATVDLGADDRIFRLTRTNPADLPRLRGKPRRPIEAARPKRALAPSP